MAHTVVTAKTFVFDAAGYLLVLKRHERSKHRPGGPDLVGGHIEGPEHYAEAAIREAQEEAGLTIDASALKLFFTNTVMVDGHNIIRFLLTTKLTEIKPAVTISWEHSQANWVAPADIDAALHDAPNMLLAYHYGLNNHLL